jgi:hypothetical protein
MLRKIVGPAAFTGALALLLAQLFRPARENPTSDPGASFEALVNPPGEVWASLQRACNDCHSNHTEWPWYSNVAPVSWLVARDVRVARSRLNLSEWIQYGPRMSQSRISDMCEEVATGGMPPWYFTAIHPQAQPSLGERTSLCGLRSARPIGDHNLE